MNWLILFLLVPAIVVPLVLLCGFAGCGLDVSGTGPIAPSDLTATAIDTGVIELDWKDNDGRFKFKVERLDGGVWTVIASGVVAPFPDGGRSDGTQYSYRVLLDISNPPYPVQSNEATATTPPNPISNLALTAQGPSHIDLQWNHVTKSNKQIGFKVEHRPKAGGAFKQVAMIIKAGDPTLHSHVNATVLTPGTEHDYIVTAVVDFGQITNQIAKKGISSAPVTGSAKTWAVAFDAKTQLAAGANQTARQGFCIVQKIPGSLLASHGTKMKITLRGPSTGNLVIDKIYISQVAATGNPYDSAADLNLVAFDVKLPVIPSPGPDPTATTLGPFPYTIPNPPKDLLIAFDINFTAGNGNLRFGTVAGVTAYALGPSGAGPITQAATADRSPVPPATTPVYNEIINRVYLIERIEVS